jgi:hypothetical protein
MKSYLHQLENNEGILLMYLANELPPADRAEVDEMLASDPNLRTELEILRQTEELAFDAIKSLDAATRPVVPPILLQHRVGELMNRWVHRHGEPALSMPIAARQLPWRRMSLAAAASLMIGYYIWAVYHPNYGSNNNNESANNTITGIGVDPYGDDIPQLPPHRDLSNQEKLALLAIPLDDSNSDESNFHVAEVAAVMPGEADNVGDSSHSSESNANSTGVP